MNIFKTFGSIKEFENYITTSTTQPNFKYAESSQQAGDSFSGTTDYATANGLLLFGDRDLQTKIENAGVAKIRKDIHKNMKRRQIYSSVVGFAPNVPAYICGAPNSMVAQKNINVKQRVMTFGYNLATDANVSKENIISVCAKLISALLIIEASGIRVNLYGLTVSIKGRQQCGYAIKIKTAGQHFDTLKMCYPLAHPSMLRRHYFRFIEVTEGVEEQFVCTYGCVQHENKKVADTAKKSGIKLDKVCTYYDLRTMTVEQIADYLLKK